MGRPTQGTDSGKFKASRILPACCALDQNTKQPATLAERGKAARKPLLQAGSVQRPSTSHTMLYIELECRHHAPGWTHTLRGGELKVLAAGPNIYEFTIAT